MNRFIFLTLVMIATGAVTSYAGPNDIGVIGVDGKLLMTYGEGINIIIRYCSDVPVFNGDYSHSGAIKACPSERGVEYVVGEELIRRTIWQSVFESMKEDQIYPAKPADYDVEMSELARKLAYITEVCPKDPKAACPAADGIRPRVQELESIKSAYEQLVATYHNVEKTAGEITTSILARIRSGAKIELAMPQKDKIYDNNIGFLLTALAKIRADYIECKSVQAINETEPTVKADPKLRVYRTVVLGSDLKLVAANLPTTVPDNNQPYQKLGESHYWISNVGAANGSFTATKDGFAFSGHGQDGNDASWELARHAKGNWELRWDIVGIEHDFMGDPKETPKVTHTSTPMICKKNYAIRKN